MKKVKITVLKTTFDKELAAEYGAPLFYETERRFPRRIFDEDAEVFTAPAYNLSPHPRQSLRA